MLPHLASRLFGTPLLVHRAKLDVILSVLGERLNIQAPTTELAVSPSRSIAANMPGIAVIPIHGTLVKRTVGLDAASGLTSYVEVGSMLEAALADPQVAGIMLDIDSPGGEASGSFELARQIRAATMVKPVWAVANDAAFSAAYALAAAANRLVVTETGGVGSIGRRHLPGRGRPAARQAVHARRNPGTAQHESRPAGGGGGTDGGEQHHYGRTR